MRHDNQPAVLLLGPIAAGQLPLPIVGTRICAGFPSPADDFLDGEIDLARILTPNRAATFLWRVAGHSMKETGIHDGDVVVVDRILETTPTIGLIFDQQVKGSHSVPDALISQKPLRMFIETKLGDGLWRDQIERHIASITGNPAEQGGETYLIGLTKTPIKAAFEETDYYDLKPATMRFYLVDRWSQTALRKETPRGLLGMRYIDLANYVPSQDVSRLPADQMAEALRDKTFE
jgi:hypothetical protein